MITAGPAPTLLVGPQQPAFACFPNHATPRHASGHATPPHCCPRIIIAADAPQNCQSYSTKHCCGMVSEEPGGQAGLAAGRSAESADLGRGAAWRGGLLAVLYVRRDHSNHAFANISHAGREAAQRYAAHSHSSLRFPLCLPVCARSYGARPAQTGA